MSIILSQVVLAVAQALNFILNELILSLRWQRNIKFYAWYTVSLSLVLLTM